MGGIIKNGADLNKFLEKIAYNMLDMTRNKIYDAIKLSIDQYYSEYHPSRYERSYKFLKSLVKTDIVKRGNELYCEVKIDENYLNYVYPYPNKFNPSYPQDYDGRDATGYDVVSWANRQFPNDSEPRGNHGYTVNAGRDDGFWDGTMEELGDIIALMKQNIEKQGVKII